MEARKLLTANEASKSIFNGLRTGWSLLQDAKTGRLPCVRIGKRVFFEQNALFRFIDNQLQNNGCQEVDSVVKDDSVDIGIARIA